MTNRPTSSLWIFPGASASMQPARHNYVEKIERMRAAGEIPEHIGLTHIDVTHDDWCAMLTHGGYCDCNPDIRVRKHRA